MLDDRQSVADCGGVRETGSRAAAALSQLGCAQTESAVGARRSAADAQHGMRTALCSPTPSRSPVYGMQRTRLATPQRPTASCRRRLRNSSIRRWLSHLEGYCVGKNGLSAYYWLRVAEAPLGELGHRSGALVEQLRSTVNPDEIDAVERNVAIAVKNNKLFIHKRPANCKRK